MKRPILYCAIAFCLGIYLASIFNIPIVYSLVSSLLLIILAVIFAKKNFLSHILLYLALIIFGAAYYQNHNILSANHIANLAPEERIKAVIKGRIADDPLIADALYGKKRTTFTVRSGYIKNDYGWRPVKGLVKVSIYSNGNIKNIGFGDEVIMEGNLSRPHGLKNPGLFDYSEYLKIKNIHAVFTVNGSDSIRVVKTASGNSMQRWAYLVRHRIDDAITNYVDKPYSGFLKAVLIGNRGELESSIKDEFIKTGTVHVLAISGLHIGLIAALFLCVFKIFHIPKRYNLIITAIALVFYSFVAGSNPPVIRATIIFVIFVLGYLINREADILNSLSIAAFLILLFNPKELFDPSFQLSFASVFSIVLFTPKIEEMLKAKPNYVIKGISVSMGACLGVLPIVAKYFNIFSPIAVIANLVIIPALFVIVVASFIFLLLYFSSIGFLLGYAVGTLSLLIKMTFYINHIISNIPFSYIRIPAPSVFFIFLYYAALFSFFYLPRKIYVLIPFLLVVNLAVWNKDFTADRKDLSITFLDVGRGDSILLEFPDKGVMLIDGGSGAIGGMNDIGRNVIAPYLWNEGIRRLDAVIITHFHEDHVGGILYVLNNFDVGCVMDNDIPPGGDNRLYNEYKKIVKDKGLRRIVIADGDEITGFGDTRLFVINPFAGFTASNANNSSVVVKLEHKSFGALFCGDILSSAMEHILAYGDLLKSDVLKVPHHGGAPGDEDVADRFFEEVSPRVSIISSDGKYLSRYLSKSGVILKSMNYNTGKNGAIKVVSDEEEVVVKPFRKNN